MPLKMSKNSFLIVINNEREDYMKNAFLSVLFMLMLCFLCGSADAYTSVSGTSGTPVAAPVMRGTSAGVMNINSMSPATYRYPSNYAHRTYVVPNNVVYGYPAGAMYPTNVHFVGGCCQPVYVMRSGMVKVNKDRSRRHGHVKTTYEEEYYED